MNTFFNGNRLNTLTLSLLGCLKTRIHWRGGQFASPLNPMLWCPNMTNDTILESFYALLLVSAKKIDNLQKLLFFFAKYTFLKSPWPCHFKYAKIYSKFWITILCVNKKTKNVQISFDGLCANNLQKILRKICAIRFLVS